MKRLCIVLPAFNEEENIERTSQVLIKKLDELILELKISKSSFILFVDDGSIDYSWQKIVNLHNKDVRVQGIKLSRNFGHQSAILAGLNYAKDNSDFTITMDADLQHDPDAIEDFVKLFNLGFDIVYGIRANRSDESAMKKVFSLIFYKLMENLDTKIIKNHADYRLMSKKAIEELFNYTERNLFLRGIIPTLGFKSTNLYYKQFNRVIGKSKYSFSKMLSLALNAITSFSIKPLRIIFYLGITSSILSFFGIIYSIINYINHKTVPGWSSIIIAIYFIGGVQLTCTGILGEYIGKIYTEAKRRPHFLIESHTSDSSIETLDLKLSSRKTSA